MIHVSKRNFSKWSKFVIRHPLSIHFAHGFGFRCVVIIHIIEVFFKEPNTECVEETKWYFHNFLNRIVPNPINSVYSEFKGGRLTLLTDRPHCFKLESNLFP